MNQTCQRILKAGNPKRINTICGRQPVAEYMGEMVCGNHLRHALAPKTRKKTPTISELQLRIRTLEEALAKRGRKL